MSLENLVKINQLQQHTTNAQEVQRLLAAATRNLADSKTCMTRANELLAITRQWLAKHRPDLLSETK